MTCPECKGHPKHTACGACGMAPKVVEIVNSEGVPTLFHKMLVPASLGDDTGDYAPQNGKYKNLLVEYEANGHVYIYSSDGIYTRLDASAVDFNDMIGRPRYAGQLMTSLTDIPDVDAVREIAESAIKPADIDLEVMTDLAVNSNQSTSVVKLDSGKTNLRTKESSTSEIPLPVASSIQAGVMNSATYEAIQRNAENIDSLMGGAKAISGISAAPTQQELTTAWLSGTALQEPTNGASILDVDNDKKWEYYSNTQTWYEVNTGGTISINQATNTTLGIVKGSLANGQVYAESDGTLSLNGWDDIQTGLSGKQSTLVSGSNIKTINGTSILGSGNLDTHAGYGFTFQKHYDTDISVRGSRPLASGEFSMTEEGTALIQAAAVGYQEYPGNWYIDCAIDEGTSEVRVGNVFTSNSHSAMGHSGMVLAPYLSAGTHTVKFYLRSASSDHRAVLPAYNTMTFNIIPLSLTRGLTS